MSYSEVRAKLACAMRVVARACAVSAGTQVLGTTLHIRDVLTDPAEHNVMVADAAGEPVWNVTEGSTEPAHASWAGVLRCQMHAQWM